MIDPLSASLNAIGLGSPAAFGLVLLAGVFSSIGPCSAPRMVAIVAISANKSPRKAAISIAAFVGGLMLAYASFGIFAALLGQAALLSRWVYISVACALLVGGIVTLLRRTDHGHCSDSTPIPTPNNTVGAAFLLGTSFAFVISPCCTPVVIAILAYCSQVHSSIYGTALLAAFALGHAVPIILLGSSTSSIIRIFARLNLNEAFRIVSGALMFALSGYYLCLA